MKVGDRIRILDMDGEPQQCGKEGIITEVGIDPWGAIYYRGTWSGCSVYPGIDRIELVEEEI